MLLDVTLQVLERSVGGLTKHEEIHARMKKAKNRAERDAARNMWCTSLRYRTRRANGKLLFQAEA
jgi:hypothetical protein